MISQLSALLSGRAEACAAGDVPALLAAARTHRVHLLLASRLMQLSPAVVPEPLRAEMRVEALRDTLRTRELVGVVAALESAGCAPVIFKGAALALTHYAESWLRPRLDADVLIAPASRVRMAAALTALGYARPPMTSGRLVMHQEMWVRPDAAVGEHVLDVHWRVANPNVLARMPAHGELRSRAARVALHGTVVAVAPPADALVIACVHRAAHHDDSEELLWVHDVQLLAGRMPAEDWQRACEVAARARVTALVLRGLDLASAAYGTVVPASILALLKTNREAEPSAVFLRPGLRPIDRLRADVAALGPVAGARLVSEHLFPPASYMREKYGVTHRALLPVAYARRIVGGASAWFRRFS